MFTGCKMITPSRISHRNIHLAYLAATNNNSLMQVCMTESKDGTMYALICTDSPWPTKCIGPIPVFTESFPGF